MKALHIAGKEDIPEVHLDKDANHFSITGNSFSDDPLVVFMPVFNWVDEYCKDPNPETVIELKMNYLNTASAKQITEMLAKFEAIKNKSKIVVKWYFDKMDEDMKYEGETLASVINVEFQLLEL